MTLPLTSRGYREGLAKLSGQEIPRDGSPPWTDAENATLRRMAADGISGGEIALALGRTRSSVSGRARRMGVRLMSNVGGAELAARIASRASTKTVKARARAPAKPSARKLRDGGTRTPGASPQVLAAIKGRSGLGRVGPVLEPLPIPLPAPASRSAPRPWVSRRIGECAYPVGGEGADTLSCCAPVARSCYCAEHAARMFQAEQPSIKKLLHDARRYG